MLVSSSLPVRGLLALAAVGSVSACKGSESVVVPPPVDAAFASVSAGLLHTCGVTVTNHMYCWGWNRDGEIGDGSTTDRVYAMAVSNVLTFSTIGAGGGHSCAATPAGFPYCWGLNLTGQVGDGSTTSRSIPVGVAGALSLFRVATGGTFTCGLGTADSAAYCWGWGPYGQLGSPPTETCPTSTGSEPCTSMPLAVLGGLRFISVSAGARHTCAVAADSTAYCWGGNDAGQLGNGSGSNAAQPVAVMGNSKFVAVTVGFSHSCGWTKTGDAYCWGDNAWGQIGAPTLPSSPVPVLVTGGVIFLSVSAGAEHTCGIGTGNTAWCWGQNVSSQLGAESFDICVTQTTGPCNLRPLAVTTNQVFASISGGGQHSCAVTTGGRAYCWGNNGNGQLGTGNTSGTNVPVLVANQP